MSAPLVRQHALELRALVDAAIRAPSGDNMQPWWFECDADAGRITISVDPAADVSPMNAGQRMSRVAIGAAAETVLQTARWNGLHATLGDSRDPNTASIRVEALTGGALQMDPAVSRRVTNRRLYEGRPISEEVLQNLRERTPEVSGVQTHWIVDRAAIQRLGAMIVSGDTLMFGRRILRDAFLENVRFDRAPEDEVEWGLSLGSLELAGGDLKAFRMLPKLPAWLLQLARIGRTFAKKTQQLIESASGICVGIAPDDGPHTDIPVGRAMQRAWLSLTEQDLATQPMMSLLVLDNLRLHGTPEQQEAVGRQPLDRVCESFRQFTGEIATGRPAFLLRFGYAEPPSGRCGRRPAELTQAD